VLGAELSQVELIAPRMFDMQLMLYKALQTVHMAHGEH
jgi:hypothetical protein